MFSSKPVDSLPAFYLAHEYRHHTGFGQKAVSLQKKRYILWNAKWDCLLNGIFSLFPDSRIRDGTFRRFVGFTWQVFPGIRHRCNMISFWYQAGHAILGQTIDARFRQFSTGNYLILVLGHQTFRQYYQGSRGTN